MENIVRAGIDEAGRGPLAGPVVAACVVLPDDFPVGILDDSKKMSERRRLFAEKIIKENALSWSTYSVSNRIIDDINILNATFLAMEGAFSVCLSQIEIDRVFIDGNRKPNIPSCETVIRGDSIVPEIMAASILAKTRRDRLMGIASKRWPEYLFDIHKGYPTRDHVLRIRKFGLCPIHRRSFRIPSYS